MKFLDLQILENNIEKAAEFDFSGNKVFGSAYFVYQEGNLSFKKCYGKLSVNSEQPVTDSTIFRLASMTKPITAVAALILAERGLIDLDGAVSKYLPEFGNINIIDDTDTNLGIPKNAPTVRNILSHCSGIGSSDKKFEKITDKDKKSIDSYVRFLYNSGLDFEPETMQRYSGTGAFDVLTKIIEKVSQTDFLSFLKKEIFEPCNMPNTTFVPTSQQKTELIAMHCKDGGKNQVYPMKADCVFEDFPQTHYLGGAGLVSTLHDYGEFAKMLLNKGKLNKKQLICEKTFEPLCQPQVNKAIMPGTERWGLGVRIITDPAYPYLPVGAFGWSGAYGSHFWIDPTNKIAAVFMKTSKFDGGAGNESAQNFEKAVYSSFKTLK